MITRYAIIVFFPYINRENKVSTIGYPLRHYRFPTYEEAEIYLKINPIKGDVHIFPVTFSCIEEMKALDAALNRNAPNEEIDAMYDDKRNWKGI